MTVHKALDGILAIAAAVIAILALAVAMLFSPLLRLVRRLRERDPDRPRRLLTVGYTALDDARSKGVIDQNFDLWFNPGCYFQEVRVVIVAGRRDTQERLTKEIFYREYGPNRLAGAFNLRATARLIGLVPATCGVLSGALRADVMQVNGPNMSAVPALVARWLTGIPSAVFIEAFWEDILPHQKLPRLVKLLLPWWWAVVYRAFDAYSGGPSMYPDRYVSLGMGRGRIHRFLNNVDAESVIKSVSKGRVPPVVAEAQHPIFVTVGRLHEEKLSADALAAFVAYAKAGGAGTLVFVGDGPLRSALVESAEQVQLTTRVVFTDALPLADAAAVVAASDVFLATYQGNALVEAMALGAPVVAYDNPPHRALAPDGVSVSFVPHHNVDALAAAMTEAVADRALLRKRGDAARSAIRKLYNRANLDETAVQPLVAAYSSKRAV